MKLCVCVCTRLHLPADSEEFASVLTELLFELHVAATPDKLNKVSPEIFINLPKYFASFTAILPKETCTFYLNRNLFPIDGFI